MMKAFFFGFVSLLLSPQTSAFTEVVNPAELRLRLGTLRPSREISDIKVAILDNGFAGFEAGKGMLLDTAEYIPGPLNLPSMSSHGLGMAQILWAMTGNKALGPKIYLIYSNGFTNFKAAVDFVVANKIDIVLYSQVWSFGSNFDGNGFINEVVNKATRKGIIWINAAGNFGDHVYSGQVQSEGRVYRLRNNLDENRFSVTLSWNDFGDDELSCTSKDLDLEILDSNNHVVHHSKLIQKGEAPDLKDPEDPRSCYAREFINVSSLNRGDYKLRVTPRSSNFGKKDAFKIIISDDRHGSLDFLDHTENQEIMPPADNASAITIGDRTSLSSFGPTADGRVKPDFLVENSKVAFTNGNMTEGSSNAAAMVAGAIAVMKSLKKNLDSKQLLSYAESLRETFLIPPGLIAPGQIPQWLQNILPSGSLVRIHPLTGRAIVFTKTDPLHLSFITPFYLRLIQRDDIIACSEFIMTCGVYPRGQDSLLGPPLIEFRNYLGTRAGSTPGIFKSTEVILSRL